MARGLPAMTAAELGATPDGAGAAGAGVEDAMVDVEGEGVEEGVEAWRGSGRRRRSAT